MYAIRSYYAAPDGDPVEELASAEVVAEGEPEEEEGGGGEEEDGAAAVGAAERGDGDRGGEEDRRPQVDALREGVLDRRASERRWILIERPAGQPWDDPLEEAESYNFV